jgi:hypothetical protein
VTTKIDKLLVELQAVGLNKRSDLFKAAGFKISELFFY